MSDERMMADLLRRQQLDLSGLDNLLRLVATGVLLRHSLVDVTLPSGATTASAPHGLGRAYRGGFVVGSSAAVLVTVDRPGTSAETAVAVRAASAPGSNVLLTVLVF